MRHLVATAAALGVIALALGVIALALAPVEAAAEDATPGLLTAEELSPPAPGSGPLILRGSAIAPKPVPAVQSSAARWQIAAGRRLWLVDPASKDLRTCAVRDTSTVDVDEIRCLSGSFGRYRRTFGTAFQP